jgi:hypothetical protein
LNQKPWLLGAGSVVTIVAAVKLLLRLKERSRNCAQFADFW